MISFNIRFRFAADDRAEIAEILRKLAEASRQEPGCLTYIPLQVESDPDTVVIWEQYKDAEAEQAHRQSAHFKKYAVGGLYQKMLERGREDLIALG